MENQADPPREPEPQGVTDKPDPEPIPRYTSRAAVPEKHRWRLEDIFPDNASWEAELAGLPARTAALAACRGRLATDAATLAAALDLASALEETFAELLAFARMRRDEDHAQTLYQDMTSRITGLYYQFAEQASFIGPVLSMIEPDRLTAWLAGEPSLSAHRQMLREIIRNKPHILSAAEESLLSRFGPVNEGINDVYSMLDTVEIDLGEITDEHSQPLKLTHAGFAQLREHPVRAVRAAGFQQIHDAYGKVGQTLSTLYSLRVKADLMFAAARRQPDAMTAALFADNLPTTLYTGLLQAIHQGQPLLDRYFALRRRLLNLTELHIYDTYIPLTNLPPQRYRFEQAGAMVRRGLAPLGPDYQQVLERHLTDCWIDVYETPGKYNGAYSWGTYRTHPYVLLNFGGLLSDVFTLAHETGHSLHTWYANQHQPFAQAQYPIFLAEIASTVNENLLMRHLIAQCDSATPEGRLQKAWLLNHFLEEFRLTVFRQAMFAEFEYLTHRKAEQGESLTAEALCAIYAGLLRQYFGPNVVVDDFMQWEWTRIPHFYDSFYVYKYATGFAAAVAISQQILQEGAPAISRYLALLAAGGSDYPLDLLRQAGVDMTTPAPVEAALTVFADTLDEFASLITDQTAL